MTAPIHEIKKAATLIKPHINQTPILTCSTLNALTGATLFFKCENFQKSGSFKFRGATNAVFSLDASQAKNGVATHSSGNHGAALALAAKKRGIPAYIVMPKDSAQPKYAATQGYGAEITMCEPGLAAREDSLKTVVEFTGATFIHPFENEQVIAGQGTIGLEILETLKNIDIIIAPVGGGGLISGIANAVKALAPRIHVIGAEPEQANDAYLSFKHKAMQSSYDAPHPTTVCDGLAIGLGKLTMPIVLEKVNDILTSSEKSILAATRYIWERMKIIVEPSAAICLAVMLDHPQFFKNKKVALVLSGGNVDVKLISALI